MSVVTVTNTADSGQGSLREAISKAKPDDIIKFSSSLANQTIKVTSRQLQVDKNLTIDGADAPNLKISGDGRNRVFFASQAGTEGTKGVQFTLKNLTVSDGFIASDRGGAIDMRSGGTLIVDNVQFYNNVSKSGAISARSHTSVTVLNSKFSGNDGARFNTGVVGGVSPTAGGVSVLNDSTLTIKNSEFTGNKGTHGGAVGTIFTETIVENSIFRNNQSTGFGGGLYVDGASWPTKDKYIPTGEKSKLGPGRNIVVRNSQFDGNTSVGFGGGIAVWSYDHDFVTIKDSSITNNRVVKAPDGVAKGGGIRLTGVATVDNTTIANNTSEAEGGGLWFDGGMPVNITNSTFSSNKAQDSNGKGLGGAIYNGLWNSSANIGNTTFQNNYAGSEAGAIFTQHHKLADIRSSVFTANSAGDASKSQISNFSVFSGIATKWLKTKSGNLMQGDSLNNQMNGTSASDRIHGGSGNDTLLGAGSNDVLAGGDGHDSMLGQTGNDVLISTSGQDWLTGGAGKDVFVVQNTNGEAIIRDFNRAEDTLQLAGKASDYTVGAATKANVSGTGVFNKGDLVALIEAVSPDALNLKAGFIKYT